MPLKRMCILRGRPVSMIRAGEPTPHYQILLNVNGVNFRIAVNARSFDGSKIYYLRKDISLMPFISDIKKIAHRDGIYEYEDLLVKNKDPKKFAPDYIRSGLLDINDRFVSVEYSFPGEMNDLNEFYDQFIEPLRTYGRARLYAFGQVWGPDTIADEYFGFLPGAGIHDIHMNQGNPFPGDHSEDNGVFQDGILITEIPEKKVGGSIIQPEQWTALFMKFETQTMNTDDKTGHPKV